MTNSSHQVFTFNKQELHYSKSGEGEPLLIIHGWGSSSRVMMPVARQLADIRSCYVVDLPGFGESPEPARAWDIDDYADIIAAFIENEIPGKETDLLVHSYGGRITLKLLARPFGKDHIGKVLITGGAGMKPRRSLKYYFRKYLAKTLKAPFMLLPDKQREKGLNKLRETDLWKSLGSGDYSKLSGVMRETFVKSVNEHMESLLPYIHHEVFLLWGEDDDATPLYQAQRMEKGIRDSALVTIKEAGHYAFLDKPKQFARIARAYLEG